MSGWANEEDSSPRSRLKFLCSCGGKILPRPSDGQLKYVGGESRIVSAPRSITFKELKDKIDGMFNNHVDMVIKYQILAEDLDALVSVRSDEDLLHMMEEYDRHESLPRSPSSSTRFRIYFIPDSASTSNGTSTSQSPTYADATSHGSNFNPTIMIPPKPPMFTFASSICSSPPSSIVDSATSGLGFPRFNARGIHRVHSTPNFNFSSISNNNNSSLASPGGGINHSQHPQHHHHHHQHRGPPHGMTRAYGSHRCEACGCESGCGSLQPGHPSPRRFYYLPRGSPTDEPYASNSSGHGGSFHYSGTSSGTPPVVPRRSDWEC